MEIIETDTSLSDIKKTASSKRKIRAANNINFTCQEYFDNGIHENLTKYKLDELKDISRKHHIKIGRNKREIISRIDYFFQKTKSAILIQKNVRSFFVRSFMNIIHKNKETIEKITNLTDFYTFEELKSLPLKDLFCVLEGDFYYGFDVHSLIMYFIKNNKLHQNPYTRTTFSLETIKRIFSHYVYLKMFFQDDVIKETVYIPNARQLRCYHYMIMASTSVRTRRSPPLPAPPRESTPPIIPNVEDRAVVHSPNEEFDITLPTSFVEGDLSPLPSPLPPQDASENDQTRIEREREREDASEINAPSPPTEIYPNLSSLERHTIFLETQRQLQSFRQMPTHSRARELFINIDLLGNYTCSSWLLGLTKEELYVFFRCLYDLWLYKAGLSMYMKNLISPLGDPFNAKRYILRCRFIALSNEELMKGCLHVMENIIMTSLDVEHRKIGCLLVLTALTWVSIPARREYPFLYESLL